jgi:hypothetical protein
LPFVTQNRRRSFKDQRRVSIDDRGWEGSSNSYIVLALRLAVYTIPFRQLKQSKFACRSSRDLTCDRNLTLGSGRLSQRQQIELAAQQNQANASAPGPSPATILSAIAQRAGHDGAVGMSAGFKTQNST